MNVIKSLWNKLFHKTEEMQEKEIDYRQANHIIYEALMPHNTAGQKKHRPVYGTNYTPPKKKRK